MCTNFYKKIERHDAVKDRCHHTMNYPANALLRYYPTDSSTHYTGVVCNKGILQVKPVRKMFPSVADWLASIPQQPTQDKLEIIRKIPSLQWKVYRPDSNPAEMWNRTKTSWSWRLYNIIMRSNKHLKRNPELCDAFNHLMDVLDGFKTTFSIRIYNGNRRQCEYVLLDDTSPSEEPWRLLPVSFYLPHSHWMLHHIDDKKKFAPQIYEAYMPLYHLMEQHGVLTYVRKLNREFKLKHLRKTIIMYERRMQTIQRKKKRYSNVMEYLHDTIYDVKQQISALEME
jgi:hypothetical protein